MFYGLGQYEEYSPDMWKGSIYDLSSVSTGAQSSSSQALPVLQSLISSAGVVLGKYFELSAVKEQAEAAKTQAEILAKLRTPTTTTAIQPAAITPTTKIAGVEWPILAIIGFGIFVVLRGRERKESVRRKRRKK